MHKFIKTYAKCGFVDRKEAQEHEAEMRLKLAKPAYSIKAAEEGKKPLKEYLTGKQPRLLAGECGRGQDG